MDAFDLRVLCIVVGVILASELTLISRRLLVFRRFLLDFALVGRDLRKLLIPSNISIISLGAFVASNILSFKGSTRDLGGNRDLVGGLVGGREERVWVGIWVSRFCLLSISGLGVFKSSICLSSTVLSFGE